MEDISRDALEKWFREEFLPNTPSLNDEWDSLSEDRKLRRMEREIERERNRRIDTEAGNRLSQRLTEGAEIPEDQRESILNDIRQEVIAENETKQENRATREHDQTSTNETGRTPVNNDRPNETNTETIERPGFTSDEWQQLINGNETRFLSEQNFRRGIDIVVLEGMGKLPNNFSSLSPEEQQDTIDRIKNELTPEERQQFNDKDRQAKKDLLEVYPPKRLVDTDKWLEDAQNRAENDTLKQQIADSRKVIMDTMVNKIDAYAKGETVVDQSNIADVYDGANLMFDYVEERTDSDKVKNDISVSRGKLEDEINKYDETNGFSGLTEDNAAEINETYTRAVKQSEKTQNPPEQYASIWNSIELSDESKREKLISSFDEAVLKQAAQKAAVKHKDAKGKELDEALKEELDAAYVEQLGALVINNEMQKHSGDKNYTPERAQKDAADAIKSLQSGQKYKVDNKAFVGNFAAYTNDRMGWLNRLGTKIGKKAPVLGNMYNGIKKFDDTCIKRFDPLYGQTKSFLGAVRGNMARQALNQVVRHGCQLIPGGNIVYGSYVAGQAAWRLATKYKREKAEAKKNGQKYSGWKFLRNHVGEITASAMLSVGAFIPGGNAALGLGSAAVAMGTSAIKTFKAARKKGNGFWKSIGKSISSIGASAGTAVTSSLLLGEAVKVSGLNDFTAEYFKETVPAGEYDPNDSHYSQSPVTDQAKIDELRQMDDKQLAESGHIYQNGVDKTAEGAFLVQEGKEGFTTRDYTQEELDFAKHRMENVLDPDDTHTGGTRYSEHLGHDWTDKSYADNPNAYDNAVKSIDELAKSHHDMSSYVDGEFKSNSDMLLYKLYQANVLAPSADALADNGQPIGEVLSYTDENGNTTNYQDVYQKVLNGEKLNESDYEVLHKVEDHVGGQHEDGVNDMGKLKNFDNLGNGGNPDSYNANADVGYELNEHPGQEEIYGRFVELNHDPRSDFIPFGMVFDNQERPAQTAMKERIGANGKTKEEIAAAKERIVKKKQEHSDVVVPKVPVAQIETKTPVANIDAKTPVAFLEVKQPKEEEHKEEKPGYGKLLADEYKILYGVDPQVIDSDKPSEHRQYQSWINYNNRVDAERQATGRDIDMYDFLTERRQKLDDVIAKQTVASNLNVAGQQLIGSEVAKDYEKHKDNPGMAAAIQGARQSLMQSNLTSKNYNETITLSHFTDYVGHYVTSDRLAADGTRDLAQNPVLKRDLFNASEGSKSEYTVVDLNDYYGTGKHTLPPEEQKKYLDGSRYQAAIAKQKMAEIARHNPKNGIVPKAQQQER